MAALSGRLQGDLFYRGQIPREITLGLLALIDRHRHVFLDGQQGLQRPVPDQNQCDACEPQSLRRAENSKGHAIGTVERGEKIGSNQLGIEYTQILARESPRSPGCSKRWRVFMTRTLGETMTRIFFGMIAWACGFLVMTSPLPADERAEIKQKIEALRAEARELARHGDEDAASNRMEKVRELSARLRKLSSSEPQADPHRSEKAEREEMLHRLARRLDQLRAASQHLTEAELPDMAHEVGRRAEELERKLRSEKERFAAELEQVEKHQGEKAKEKMPPIVAQQNKQLREEHQRLVEEHEAWGRKVKEELARYSEVINDIRAEQEKMRREFKELRKLIERLHRDKERG